MTMTTEAPLFAAPTHQSTNGKTAKVTGETVMEINGKHLTREQVRAWLLAKRITLWMDWLITDPRQMEKAIDWFIKSVNELGTI